jgi:hypothetical protein
MYEQLIDLAEWGTSEPGDSKLRTDPGKGIKGA